VGALAVCMLMRRPASVLTRGYQACA